MAKQNVTKLLVAVSLVGFLTYAMSFAFYKSFNKMLDNLVLEILDFFAYFGVNLNVETFWLITGIILLLSIVFIIKRDKK